MANIKAKVHRSVDLKRNQTELPDLRLYVPCAATDLVRCCYTLFKGVLLYIVYVGAPIALLISTG